MNLKDVITELRSLRDQGVKFYLGKGGRILSKDDDKCPLFAICKSRDYNVGSDKDAIVLANMLELSFVDMRAIVFAADNAILVTTQFYKDIREQLLEACGLK